MTPLQLIFISVIVSTAFTAQNSISDAQERTSFAVLDLEARGISLPEASSLSDRLRAVLVRTNEAIIIERGQMEQILREQDFNLSGCTSDECAVEVGQLLGVTNMIAGTVGKVGSTFSVDIRVIAVETGRITRSLSKDYQGPIDGLLGLMTIVAEELVGIVPSQSTSELETRIQTPIKEKDETQSGIASEYASLNEEELFNAISIEDLQSVAIGDSVLIFKYFFGFALKPALIVGIDTENPNRVQVSVDDKLSIVKAHSIIKKQPWLIPYDNGYGEYYISIGDFVIYCDIEKRKVHKGIVNKISGRGNITIESDLIIRGLQKIEKHTTSIKGIVLIKGRN